ncbi:uncharacterized protein LOC114519789 [Dendronephthya gigantea]|uniref:uncharacterized protein LOC114519789 n=1 Tax=Dendronephthya gigantea TaxID=151771 RepID=UPI00106C0C60|nr:uncharacterized protein LOC114519789 [Dendronephthya gigantea]
MDELNDFRCDYCNFVCCSADSTLFFAHLVKFHSNEPNFKVYCGSCPRSFKKVNTLQKHYTRKHKAADLRRQPNIEQHENNSQADGTEEFEERTARSNMQLHAAKFLLCAEAQGKLTQNALDLVKDSTKNLLAEYLDIVKKSLVAKIHENGDQEFQFSHDMEELFSADDIFNGLDSAYQQRSYYSKNFNLVEPVEVELGKEWKYVFSGGRKKLKRVSVLGYQIPLLKSLEALLQNPDILKEVDNAHCSDDDVLRDVMDGEFFRSHPIFSCHKDALQLFGYYDDLEIANPLGSKAKIHKIGVFYFVLGNIRPIFRSTVRCIQLIGVARTNDIKKFAIDGLLEPFIKDVNTLAKVDGYCFSISGTERVFRGSLLLWTGDTLGSNHVSGFKEGVGGAFRICRHCMGTREECNHKFLSEEFQERNLTAHRQICSFIEDEDNAREICNRLSKTYGVNRLSVLNKVEHFDVCKCFPEDIMHILLEGLVPYEMKLLLKELIDEVRCLTLRELNHRIDSFDYGYMNCKNKPTNITRETLSGLNDTKLKQTASQTWCLCRFLPNMIGDKVDSNLEYWQCFLKLWNIVQICVAPAITQVDVACLKVIISEHHVMFKRLYPHASIIPKMHYLIHVPDEILRFGPPRNIWTMRFEAKHSFLKSSITKNFKNVPKSVAFAHQREMCWNLMASPEQTMTNYLYSGDVVGPGDYDIDLNGQYYSNMLAAAAGLSQLPQPCTGSRVKHVEIHGVRYRPGCALRLQEMDDLGERDYPCYGIVEEILIWEDGKFFVVKVLETIAFHHHFMSYEVNFTDKCAVVVLDNLPWHGVLNVVKKNAQMFVVEKDTVNIESM